MPSRVRRLSRPPQSNAPPPDGRAELSARHTAVARTFAPAALRAPEDGHHVRVQTRLSTGGEVVLRGVVELRWEQITALSVFLVALGALLRFGDLRIAAPATAENPVQGAQGAAKAGDSRRPWKESIR